MTNLFQIMDNCGGAGPIVAFIKNGVYPIDMYTSIDEDTNNIILAVVFLKEETTEVYKKWCNHELT